MNDTRFDRMQSGWRALIVALAMLGAGATGLHADTITVLGAASLQDVLVDVAKAFERANPGVKVEFSFAGTSTLRTQIENGAAFDVFVAADTLHPQALLEQELIRDPRVFAHSSLVLVTRKDWFALPGALDAAATLRSGASGSPGSGVGDSPVSAAGALRGLGPQEKTQMMLESLRRPDARVVVANEMVPAGRYTRAALDRMSGDPKLGPGFRDAVERRIVSLESSVRHVLAKVVLGEADAGFVYMTDVKVEEDRVHVTALPEAWNTTASYAVAVSARTRERGRSQAFVEFLTSPRGKAHLRRHRFQD